MPRHKARAVRQEEIGGVGDILGLAQSLHGHAADDRLGARRVVRIGGLEQLRLDRAGADVLDDALLHFTERELQVLRVWALTNTARDAAGRLDLAQRTIEAHLKNMRRKLGVKRSMDVMLYARDRGWV
mgnify:CR=1 FL=1